MAVKQKKCKNCHEIFIPERPLQCVCSPKCAIERYQSKKREKESKIIEEEKEHSKLLKQADRLYQEVGKLLNPISIISGRSTQVIHHWIYKSQSNNTRYYLPNGIPLTNDEHGKIHGKRGNEAKDDVVLKKDKEWLIDLDQKKRIDCKLTIPYLKEQIEILKNFKEKLQGNK
jgi:hypothetical protein